MNAEAALKLEGIYREEDQDGWRWYVNPITGEKFISVTKVLDCIVHERLKNWFIKNTAKAIEKKKTEATTHGSAAHGSLEQWAKGEKVELDPRLYALIETHKIKPLRSEFIVTSPLGFAGQVDLLAEFNGKTFALDLKTGNRFDVKSGYQLAAYRCALNQSGQSVDGMAVLSLPRDGSEGKVFIYEHYDFCLQRFLSALECFKGLYFTKLNKSNWQPLKQFSPATFTWETT